MQNIITNKMERQLNLLESLVHEKSVESKEVFLNGNFVEMTPLLTEFRSEINSMSSKLESFHSDLAKILVYQQEQRKF